MSLIHVAGMDPSLTNWASSYGTFDFEKGVLAFQGLSLMSPLRETNKGVRQSSKDLQEAEQLMQEAMQIAQKRHVLFVECPSGGTQDHRSVVSYGVCVGILASLRCAGIPIIEVTAKEVKIAATGDPNATKKQVIDAMVAKYPHLNWPTYKRNGKTLVTASKAEHMADATAAVLAGFNTAHFKSLLPILAQVSKNAPAQQPTPQETA